MRSIERMHLGMVYGVEGLERLTSINEHNDFPLLSVLNPPTIQNTIITSLCHTPQSEGQLVEGSKRLVDQRALLPDLQDVTLLRQAPELRWGKAIQRKSRYCMTDLNHRIKSLNSCMHDTKKKAVPGSGAP